MTRQQLSEKAPKTQGENLLQEAKEVQKVLEEEDDDDGGGGREERKPCPEESLEGRPFFGRPEIEGIVEGVGRMGESFRKKIADMKIAWAGKFLLVT